MEAPVEPNETSLSEFGPDALEAEPAQPEPPVALSKPVSAQRVCNGARLGRKRAEVEWLLTEGVPKLEIARRMQISAHSVRAVARDMDQGRYAAVSGGAVPSGDLPAVSSGEPAVAPTKRSLPDTLKAKAMQAVDHITTDKLVKASPQA